MAGLCLAAPDQTLGPIDISGEYLVHAIRTEYALAGRQIAIIGHSHGGMSMRWALRFWPDTRKMVADVVGLEPDNDGTTVITDQLCATLGCPAADWDQTYESPFIEALNSGAQTFAGISYTNTYSVDDELVHPDSGPGNCSSCMSTGAGRISNVELQSICPLDTSEHVEGGTTDPVPYALGIDAITHSGPADPARIPKSVCDQSSSPQPFRASRSPSRRPPSGLAGPRPQHQRRRPRLCVAGGPQGRAARGDSGRSRVLRRTREGAPVSLGR